MNIVVNLEKLYGFAIVTRSQVAKWDDLTENQKLMWCELRSNFKTLSNSGELSINQKCEIGDYITANMPETIYTNLPFRDEQPLFNYIVENVNGIDFILIKKGTKFYKGFHEFIYPDEESELFNERSIIYYGRLTEARFYAGKFYGGINAYQTTSDIPAVYVSPKTVTTVIATLQKLLKKTKYKIYFQYMLSAMQSKYTCKTLQSAQKAFANSNLQIKVEKKASIVDLENVEYISAPYLEISKEIDNLCLLAIRLITNAECIFTPFVKTPYADRLLRPEMVFFKMKSNFKRSIDDPADWTNWKNILDFTPPANFLLSHFYYKLNFNCSMLRKYILLSQNDVDTIPKNGIVYFDVNNFLSINALDTKISAMKFISDFVKKYAPRLLVLSNILGSDITVLREILAHGSYNFISAKLPVNQLRICLFYNPAQFCSLYKCTKTIFKTLCEQNSIFVQIVVNGNTIAEYLFFNLSVLKRSSLSLEIRKLEDNLQSLQITTLLTLFTKSDIPKFIMGNLNSSLNREAAKKIMNEYEIGTAKINSDSIFAFSSENIKYSYINNKFSLNRGIVLQN